MSEEKKQFLPDIIDVNKPGIKFEITNFDEIKTALAEVLEEYKNFELTDNISEAKELRARLNKVSDALNTKKISVKKAYLEPYEYGEGQIKDLISMISNVSSTIDVQIKGYEERMKQKKKEDIKSLFDTFANPRNIKLEQLFVERWLNAGTTIKSIEKELTDFFTKLEADIGTIESLMPDEDRRAMAINLFIEYLDMGKAVQEEKRIYDLNHKPKPAPTIIVATQTPTPQPIVEEVIEAQPTPVSTSELKIEDFYLTISGTKNQLIEVRDFLKAKGIAYKFERR